MQSGDPTVALSPTKHMLGDGVRQVTLLKSWQIVYGSWKLVSVYNTAMKRSHYQRKNDTSKIFYFIFEVSFF